MAKRKLETLTVEEPVIVKEPVIEEPKVDTEEDKKARYNAYRKANDDSIRLFLGSLSNTLNNMSTTQLVDYSRSYISKPTSFLPETVYAIEFHLSKRGRKEEVRKLMEFAQAQEWFSKPWVLF